jgi:hypothetical protein
MVFIWIWLGLTSVQKAPVVGALTVGVLAAVGGATVGTSVGATVGGAAVGGAAVGMAVGAGVGLAQADNANSNITNHITLRNIMHLLAGKIQ